MGVLNEKRCKTGFHNPSSKSEKKTRKQIKNHMEPNLREINSKKKFYEAGFDSNSIEYL
jgi:hypothetical protein